MCRPAGWFTKDVNREVAAEVAAPDMMDYCESARVWEGWVDVYVRSPSRIRKVVCLQPPSISGQSRTYSMPHDCKDIEVPRSCSF